MTQQPIASVNGMHHGRPSQIRLGSNATGQEDAKFLDENHYDRVNSPLNGDRPQHLVRQSSGKQIPHRPRAALQLNNGDISLDNTIGPNEQEEDAQDNWQMRHGWEDQYNSEEYLSLLSSVSQTRSRKLRSLSRSAQLTPAELLHVLYRQAS